MDLFGLLGAGAGGIITGLVGPLVKGVLSYKQQKLQFEHEEKMVKAESDATIAEAEANIKATRVQTEGEIKVAEVGALSQALKDADKQIFTSDYMQYLVNAGKFGAIVAAVIAFGLACVEMLRQALRPSATIYLLAADTVLTVMCYRILQAAEGAITVTFAQEIFKMSVYIMLYLVVAAFNFWFVSRDNGLAKKIAARI